MSNWDDYEGGSMRDHLFGRHSEAESNDGWDVALVCLNGHVINAYSERVSGSNEPFCSSCGKKTINSCPKCQKKIRGEYWSIYSVGGPAFEAPAFCGQCGEPFPWTAAKLNVAAELMSLEGINEGDQSVVIDDLKELASNSPKTDLAIYRTKKLIAKLGQGAGQVIQKIVVDISTEYVKKQFGI